MKKVLSTQNILYQHIINVPQLLHIVMEITHSDFTEDVAPFISAVTRYLRMGLCIVVSLTYKYNVLEHVDALGTDLDSSCTKWMEGTESKPVTGTCAAPVANISK